MICKKCNYENTAEAVCCAECGLPLIEEEKLCKKCNHKNSAEAEFCEKCGKSLKKKKAKKKLWISLVAIVTAVAMVCISFFVFDKSNAKSEIEKQIELGYRYLAEGKYEEAILAFDKAIEIDSKSVDSYIGKAKAQAKIIDDNTVENIVDTLEKGYNETQNKKVVDALCEISEMLTQDGYGELSFELLKLGYERLKSEEVAECLYAKADSLWVENKLGEATKIFMTICDYKDSRQRVSEWNKRLSSGRYHTIGLRADGKVLGSDRSMKGNLDGCVAVSLMYEYSMGVKPDGTVVVCDLNGDISSENVKKVQSEIDSWKEIESVSVGGFHAVGLRKDGKIVGVKLPDYMEEEDASADYLASRFSQKKECLDGMQKAMDEWDDITMISVGYYHTVGLKSDGTVVVVGSNEKGQCNVSEWNDIVSISANGWHTLGLKSDGTVVAVGENGYGQCDVSEWRDIVSISTGPWYTVGLKSDGTVVYVGDDKYFQDDISEWNDMIAISTGLIHTTGLKSDGSAISTHGEQGMLNAQLVGYCEDIKMMDFGVSYSVALRNDGTVYAVGDNEYGQCNVDEWRDIVSVSAGSRHIVGLKSDGTVVAVGDNEHGQCNVSEWKDIKEISTGYEYTIGVKTDGTVVAVGDNKYGQCDVSEWRDLASVCTDGKCSMGLKTDGSVVLTSKNALWQKDVSEWKDVKALSFGGMGAVGLKADGTVYYHEGSVFYKENDLSEWTDIVRISVGTENSVGLKSDGTVVVAGSNLYGVYDAVNWKDIVDVKADAYSIWGKKSDGTWVSTGLYADCFKWKLF